MELNKKRSKMQYKDLKVKPMGEIKKINLLRSRMENCIKNNQGKISEILD